jgi:type I restriction enzyme S subunit
MAGEWREVTLSDLAAPGSPITYGVVKPGPEDPNGVLFIRGGDIADGRVRVDQLRTITREVSAPYKRTVLHGGELVVSLVGNPGQLAIVPVELRGANIARQVGLIRLRDDVDARFVKYSLSSVVGQASLDAESRGSVQQVINLGDLRTVHLQLPPLSEQRGIAHILGTLDDKIELNRRMNETLEAIAQALFKSWFVDFDPVRAKSERRDTGLPPHLADLFPDSFEDSELGEIPTGWHVRLFADVLSELETGGRPKGGVSGYTTGIPSIGAESIVGLGVFDYSKTKYVPREFFAGMSKGRVQSRDVLLYKDGGRPGEFEPHVTLFGDGFPFGTCAINEHVYRMRATDELGQNLLFFWLSSDLVMEEMRIKGTGVAIPGLNSTQVKSLTTLVPAREVVCAFNGLVEPWVARVLATCSESHTLTAIRDTLLARLVSGKLRVSVLQPGASSAT